MTAALFRAEFLRALPVLPWLLGSHALMFGLRTFWRDEFTPRLGGVLEWLTWALALLVLVGSLWQDSPARPDRFAAARPVRLSMLLLAKVAALLILVALPFVAVEWGSLVWWEMPVGIIGAGTLQTAIFAMVAVLAAFPFVWFWRNAVTAFSGAAIAFLAGAIFLRCFGENPLNFNGPRWIGLDYLMTAPVMFAAVAVAGILSAVMLTLLPKRGHPLPAIPCFAAIVCLALGTSLWLRTRHVASSAAERAPLVSLQYTPQQHDSGYATRLDIRPPSLPANPEIERSRTFTKLRTNGHDVLRWSEPQTGRSLDDQLSPAVRATLVKRYGTHLDLPTGPGELEPATAIIDNDYPPKEPLQFDLQIREIGVQWQIVAELPIVEGATARHQDTRWTIKQITNYGQRSTSRDALIVEQFPKLWLGDILRPPWQTHWEDRYFLIDPESGQVMPVWPQLMPGAFSARTTLQQRNVQVFLRENQWSSDQPPKIDWSRDYRIVIMRAVSVETTYFDWSSPGPVVYPSQPLQIPWIASLKSLPLAEPPLRNLTDAAHFARCGLGWLAEDVLYRKPLNAGMSQDEWLAWFRLYPSAKTFRALAAGVLSRDILEREADAQLAGYQVALPNPYVDATLNLALARGSEQAPRWLKEAIMGRRSQEPRFGGVWVADPIRDAFTIPDHLKHPDEVVDWFLAQDPSQFAFNVATGKYQLR